MEGSFVVTSKVLSFAFSQCSIQIKKRQKNAKRLFCSWKSSQVITIKWSIIYP